jgi:DNA-binding response OmpR family regulator
MAGKAKTEKASSAKAKPAAKAKPKLDGRILVADDDPELLGLLSLRLKKLGYDVIEASDGEQALKAARKDKPELIVLDVMMPVKNGWEVARELRHDEATKHIGIVVLTAIGEKMNEMTSPLYGADEYIDKPFEFDRLEKAIATTLKKTRK